MGAPLAGSAERFAFVGDMARSAVPMGGDPVPPFAPGPRSIDWDDDTDDWRIVGCCCWYAT